MRPDRLLFAAGLALGMTALGAAPGPSALAPTAHAQPPEEPPGEEPTEGSPAESPEASPETAWYASPGDPPAPAEEPPAEPVTDEASEAEPAEAGDPEEPEADDGGWEFRPNGFVRAGYEYVFDDPRYDFVGDNAGFVLGNARVGVAGRWPAHGLSFRINVDGAAVTSGLANTPEAQLSVALRDAWIRWDFLEFLGAQIGQFKIPFMAGWLGRDGALPFASRAVGLDGVGVGRGFEQSGIVLDREIGLTLGSPGPVFVAGDFGVGYHLSVFNGNGINEALNDNVRPAVAGRVELFWTRNARIGAGVLWNSRTVGPLPDRLDEEDVGFSADLSVEVIGIEVFGHFTLLSTSYPTSGLDPRQRLEFHVQAGYDLPFIEFPFVVGYRFAYYDPWQSGGANGPVDLSAFELMYHTVGLRMEHPVEEVGLTLWLNYTFTVETEARSLDNDRIEAIVQLRI